MCVFNIMVVVNWPANIVTLEKEMRNKTEKENQSEISKWGGEDGADGWSHITLYTCQLGCVCVMEKCFSC